MSWARLLLYSPAQSLYSPASGTFKVIGTMTTARFSQSETLLIGGAVPRICHTIGQFVLVASASWGSKS
jgi:hypothetical protein